MLPVGALEIQVLAKADQLAVATIAGGILMWVGMTGAAEALAQACRYSGLSPVDGTGHEGVEILGTGDLADLLGRDGHAPARHRCIARLAVG